MRNILIDLISLKSYLTNLKLSPLCCVLLQCYLRNYITTQFIISIPFAGSFISGLLHPLLHRNFVQDLQNLQGNLRRRGASLSQVQVNYVVIHHSILLFIITSKFHPRKKCIPQTRGRRQEGLTRRHCSYANSLKMISTR